MKQLNIDRDTRGQTPCALAKVDHALAQLRQMKEGQLQGINAEELLNEL